MREVQAENNASDLVGRVLSMSKGEQDNPVHQSDLGLVKVDYGQGFTWAANIRGVAGHRQLERIANGEPRPTFADEFAGCLEAEPLPVRYFEFAHKDADAALVAQRKHELIDEGDRMVRALLSFWSPNRLNVVGAELSFRWCDPQTSIWYAGTCDLISRDPLVLWDYKFGEASPHTPSIMWSAQHHLYSIAAKLGRWTRKARYFEGEHRLDFSRCDDWFTIGEWPGFVYVWMPGALRKASTVNKAIVADTQRYNTLFPAAILPEGKGLSVSLEGVRAMTEYYLRECEQWV